MEKKHRKHKNETISFFKEENTMTIISIISNIEHYTLYGINVAYYKALLMNINS